MKVYAKRDWPIKRSKNWHPQSASIIIDNYNYAAFISKAIDSALAQTHKAQVIVVDDGSTDGSQDIIASYGRTIESVLKENGGHASAFNAGFTQAHGDIVLFLDSDDMIESNAVETLLEIWRPEAVVAHYAMTVIDSNDNPRGSVPGPHSRLLEGDARDELLTTGTFPSTVTSGMAFARNVLDQIMPIPEADFSQGADGYLVRAAAFFGPFQYVDSRLSRYRVHDRNDSNPWGARRTVVAGFRHRIKLEQNFLETTRKFAAAFKLPVSSDLGERNLIYVSSRLFSLVLDPANHPITSDRRSTLLRRYIARSWASPTPLRRRVMEITVATLSVLSKPSTAMVLVRWMGDSNARPSWFKNLADKLRRKQDNQPHSRRTQ